MSLAVVLVDVVVAFVVVAVIVVIGVVACSRCRCCSCHGCVPLGLFAGGAWDAACPPTGPVGIRPDGGAGVLILVRCWVLSTQSRTQ